MPELPKINRMKFGVIDESYMNTLADAAENFNSMKPAIDASIAKVRRLKSSPFLAIITSKVVYMTKEVTRANGTVETFDIMWKYQWKTVGVTSVDQDELQIADTDPVVTSEDISRSIDVDPQGGEWTGEVVSGLAFNLAEVANSSNYDTGGVIFGVNVRGSSYPTGFIPYGTEVGSYVMLQKIYANDMSAIYFFDRQGTHDGNCE